MSDRLQARKRPLMLDLFCGAGGCAVGYHRAGFDVIGVDIKPQPQYPFAFVEADALDFLRGLVAGASVCGYYLGDFAAIHASPPCQRYSIARHMPGAKGDANPDLVPLVQKMLVASGKMWVIENVEGAPLNPAVMVCGLALGLAVKRHRLFASSHLLFGTTCPRGHKDDFVSIWGHDVLHRRDGKRWVSVHGGGASTKDGRRRATVQQARIAMGIDWMVRDELSQAIPPAYTEYIGRQLIRYLEDK